MGNCLKNQSPTKYDGGSDDDNDDWDFLTGEEGSFVTTKAATTAKTVTEVKIKITKKQLEELLSKVDVRELRVEQGVAKLPIFHHQVEWHMDMDPLWDLL
ncbi:hypothetical protein JHK85_023651 [Glycine max]|nr:hypothetical protein JHK85_023651 [Glycine max]